MANPWAKKNPLLSMWLSGANVVASKAHGAGAAEAKRQQTSSTKQAARFWSGTWLAAVKASPKAMVDRAVLCLST